MKKTYLFLYVFMLVFVFLVGCSRGEPVVFTDNYFEDVVKNNLDNKEGTIFTSDLKNMDELYIYGEKEHFKLLPEYTDGSSNINSIEEIEYMKNLEKLVVSNIDIIVDLEVISELENLKMLEITGTNIRDIDVFSSLTSLETLILNNNRIEDISSLAYLNNLRILLLEGNNIQDISSLKFLDDLVYLNLEGKVQSFETNEDYIHIQYPYSQISVTTYHHVMS